MTPRALLEVWNTYWFTPSSPASLCAFRAAIGLLVFVTGILLGPDLFVWFGSHGMSSVNAIREWENGPRLSLLLLFPNNDAVVLALYATLLLSSLTLMLGLFSRPSAAIVFLCLLSFDHRNPVILNSGDTFLRLSAFLMMFGPIGARYSLDRVFADRRHPPTIQAFEIKASPAVQHLLQFQTAAVYFQAFWSKLAGETWINGTAIYYTSRLVEFKRLPVPYLFDNILSVKLITWATLAVEGALWTLIWVPKCRYAVLLCGVLLHLGIEWSMNLPVFEYVMMSAYLLFIDASDMDKCVAHLRSLVTGRRNLTATPYTE